MAKYVKSIPLDQEGLELFNRSKAKMIEEKPLEKFTDNTLAKEIFKRFLGDI